MNAKTNLETMILAVVSEAPKHGYEIAKAIHERSAHLLKPSESQLYPALHKLEAEGHLSSEWLIQEGKRDRKVYAITESGTAKLTTNRKSWEKYVAGVGAILKVEASHG